MPESALDLRVAQNLEAAKTIEGSSGFMSIAVLLLVGFELSEEGRSQ